MEIIRKMNGIRQLYIIVLDLFVPDYFPFRHFNPLDNVVPTALFSQI